MLGLFEMDGKRIKMQTPKTGRPLALPNRLELTRNGESRLEEAFSEFESSAILQNSYFYLAHMEDENRFGALISCSFHENDKLALDGTVHFLSQGNLVILLFECFQGRHYFLGLLLYF